MNTPFILLEGNIKYSIFRTRYEVTVIASIDGAGAVGKGATLKEAMTEVKRVMSEISPLK